MDHRGTHHLAQRLESFFDPRVPVRPTTEPQAVGVAATRRKDIARRKADSFFQRLTEELAALDGFWQFHPQHVAADWPGHFRAMGKYPVDCANHPVDVFFEDAS